MALLTKQEIIQALTQLGKLAEQQGHSIELLMMGGAAMVLMYDIRPSTRDVDVLVLSPAEPRIVRDLAEKIAQEHSWPSDWLNDGAKGYLVGISQGDVIFSAPGITVKSPTIAQLLAMKLSAWRDDVDIEDARRLLQTLEGDEAEMWSAVEPFLVPGAELKAQYAFLDLWETTYGSD